MLRHASLILAICLMLPAAGRAADDRFFDSNGVRIRYTDQGHGEPVVLVHAFTTNIELQWVERGVMPVLLKDYRVIALDNRGHGKSGKPHDPQQYGREMAEDVVRLLDHLKIKKAHVVGYSLGGHITLRLLATHPDRLLTATVGGTPLSSPAFIRSWHGLADEIDQGRGFGPLREKVYARNDMKALAAVLRGLKDLSVSAEELKAMPVKVPTLYLVGDKDPINVKELQGCIRHLKTVIIAGGDHINTPGRPQFASSLKEFLKANASKPGN